MGDQPRYGVTDGRDRDAKILCEEAKGQGRARLEPPGEKRLAQLGMGEIPEMLALDPFEGR